MINAFLLVCVLSVTTGYFCVLLLLCGDTYFYMGMGNMQARVYNIIMINVFLLVCCPFSDYWLLLCVRGAIQAYARQAESMVRHVAQLVIRKRVNSKPLYCVIMNNVTIILQSKCKLQLMGQSYMYKLLIFYTGMGNMQARVYNFIMINAFLLVCWPFSDYQLLLHMHVDSYVRAVLERDTRSSIPVSCSCLLVVAAGLFATGATNVNRQLTISKRARCCSLLLGL